MSIYYKYAPYGTKIIILSYVDYCVHWYTSEAIIKWFVDTPGERFHTSSLGYAHWFMSIRFYQMKENFISLYQDRYDTSIVAKYLDNATFKTSTNFYKTNFPYDMIFTKADTSTSDDKVEKLAMEFNISYRSCIRSLIYLLSTRVDLGFSVHKLTKFSSNPSKVHFEGFVNLLRYIRDNKTLRLKYYADMKYAYLSDLLIQGNIKTENQLTTFSDSSCQHCTDTVRSTGAYIIFYQGGPLD